MTHHHECIAHYRKDFAVKASSESDAAIEDALARFKSVWKGSKPGGDFDTPSWRVYKRAYRQEAHRRGLI